jgi:hypothetical protein
MKVNTTTVTTTTHTAELHGSDILHLVCETLGLSVGSVKSYSVYVTVPGGGDWSNQRLNMNEEKVQVEIVVEEVQ